MPTVKIKSAGMLLVSAGLLVTRCFGVGMMPMVMPDSDSVSDEQLEFLSNHLPADVVDHVREGRIPVQEVFDMIERDIIPVHLLVPSSPPQELPAERARHLRDILVAESTQAGKKTAKDVENLLTQLTARISQCDRGAEVNLRVELFRLFSERKKEMLRMGFGTFLEGPEGRRILQERVARHTGVGVEGVSAAAPSSGFLQAPGAVAEGLVWQDSCHYLSSGTLSSDGNPWTAHFLRGLLFGPDDSATSISGAIYSSGYLLRAAKAAAILKILTTHDDFSQWQEAMKKMDHRARIIEATTLLAEIHAKVNLPLPDGAEAAAIVEASREVPEWGEIFPSVWFEENLPEFTGGDATRQVLEVLLAPEGGLASMFAALEGVARENTYREVVEQSDAVAEVALPAPRQAEEDASQQLSHAEWRASLVGLPQICDFRPELKHLENSLRKLFDSSSIAPTSGGQSQKGWEIKSGPVWTLHQAGILAQTELKDKTIKRQRHRFMQFQEALKMARGEDAAKNVKNVKRKSERVLQMGSVALSEQFEQLKSLSDTAKSQFGKLFSEVAGELKEVYLEVYRAARVVAFIGAAAVGSDDEEVALFGVIAEPVSLGGMSLEKSFKITQRLRLDLEKLLDDALQERQERSEAANAGATSSAPGTIPPSPGVAVFGEEAEGEYAAPAVPVTGTSPPEDFGTPGVSKSSGGGVSGTTVDHLSPADEEQPGEDFSNEEEDSSIEDSSFSSFAKERAPTAPSAAEGVIPLEAVSAVSSSPAPEHDATTKRNTFRAKLLEQFLENPELLQNLRAHVQMLQGLIKLSSTLVATLPYLTGEASSAGECQCNICLSDIPKEEQLDSTFALLSSNPAECIKHHTCKECLQNLVKNAKDHDSGKYNMLYGDETHPTVLGRFLKCPHCRSHLDNLYATMDENCRADKGGV